MKVGFAAVYASPDELARMAQDAEELGFDALWTSETRHDPFIGLAIAAKLTSRISLRTGLAVAFARTPMTMSTLANDVQLVSRGRFHLGMGSQIKPHITRRFSMPWSQPVPRMREYVMALRTIWDAYGPDKQLRFRGEFYRHTLKVPYFDPGPNPYGPPPILLGAVGPRMTALAGELADGLMVHSASSERFLKEVTLPLLRRSREASGQPWEEFELNVAPIIATGRTEEEYAAAIRMAKEQIAFYTSIPTYGAILELHNLTEMRTELHKMAAYGRISEMPDVIDDSVLDTFAIVGEPKEAAAKIMERFGGVADTLTFYNPDVTDPYYWLPLMEQLRSLQAAAVA